MSNKFIIRQNSSLIIILFIITCFACRQERKSLTIIEHIQNKKECDSLIFSKTITQLSNFKLSTNNLSSDIEKSNIECVKIKELYEQADIHLLDSLTNNIMLKLLYQNFSTANQSYGIGPITRGCAAPIFDHFIARNNLNDEEFITSYAVAFLIDNGNLNGGYNKALFEKIKAVDN